jgi:hypothetical protein
MFIFSIFTCSGHIDRIQALEETCIPNELPDKCKLYYVYGGSEEASEEGRNLNLTCRESYDYLLEKTYETLRYILRFDFDYFIKLDNDIYIPDFELLVEKLHSIKSQGISFATTSYGTLGEREGKPYLNPGVEGRIWHYKKVPEGHQKPYTGFFLPRWAQGHCYVLSKENCKTAVRELDKTKEYKRRCHELYEDIAISDIMFKNSVELHEIGPLVEHLMISHKGLTAKAILNRHAGE